MKRGVGHGEQRDPGEDDGRDRRCGARDHLGDGSRRLGELLPRHDRDGSDRNRDIEERGARHGEDETKRKGALGIAGLLRDIDYVLEADKGEEGEHGPCMTRSHACSPPGAAGVAK